MKAKKLLISIALILLSVSAHAYDFSATYNGKTIYYNITSSIVPYTVEVTRDGYSGSYAGSVTIPASVTYSEKTYAVTSIGSAAFFDCFGLTAVTIGNSVTSIGISAFYGCTGLTALTIPSSLTSIGVKAFNGCTGLMELTIPNAVTSIGGSAFSGCSGLTELTIPSSVTSIGSSAFYRCTGLKDIVLEDGTATLSSEGSTFENCPVESVYLGRDISCDSYWSPFRDKTALTALTIGNSVTSIGGSAFSGCTGLTALTIGNSVTEIESYAFSGCTGLTALTIGNSVTEIGNDAFSHCSGLMELSIGDSVTEIGMGAFFNCTGLAALTIGNSVTEIGNDAFSHCSGLMELSIGDSVTSIGDWAFSGCTGLTALTIPSSLTLIGEGAFYDCTGLKDIVLEDGTDNLTIGNAFVNCPVESVYLGRNFSCYNYFDSPFRDKTTLTSLTIGNSVTSIGDEAFAGCTGLKDIVLEDGTATLSFGTTSSSNSYSYIFENCPVESVYLGRNISYYSPFSPFGGKTTLASLTIGNSVTSIGNYAFYDCTGLTELTIGNSVTSIGDMVFYGCTGLTALTIPNSVTSIGEGAFYDCTGLKDIVLEDGTAILSSGGSTFENCPVESVYLGRDISCDSYWSPFRDKTALTALTIGNSVTSIGDGAFSGCTELKDIVLEDGTATLSFSEGAIADCPVETVYLGRNISSFPFGNKTTLTSLTIGNSVTSIGDYAFSGCTGLTELTIGNSVTSIGARAFSYCTGLTGTLTIPNSVTSIGDWAFSGCFNFTSVTNLNPTPQPIDSYTFGNIAINNIPLYVPAQSVEAYKAAPVWQNFKIITAYTPSAIHTPSTATAIRICPDPATGSFRIEGLTAPTQVSVMDINGETVLQQTVSGDESISVGHLSQGVYIVNVNGKTVKIIKSF